MRRVVHLHEVIHGYVGVPLGRRERSVAEELLDRAEIGSAVEEVGGARVPQRVRVQIRTTRAERAIPVYERLNRPRPHALSARGDEERRGFERAGAPVGETRPPSEVRAHRVHTLLPERHDALLVSFSDHSDRRTREVYVAHVEPAQLADAKPRPVQQLENRPIARPRGVAHVRRLDHLLCRIDRQERGQRPPDLRCRELLGRIDRDGTPSPEPASIPEPEPTPEPAQPKPEKPKRSRKKKESKEPSIADLDKEIAEINDKLHSDVIQGWSNVQAMHKRRAELVEKKKKLLGGELPKKEITLEEVGRHIEEARNAARGRNRGLGPMDESPYNSIMPPETTPDGREIGGGEDYWLGIKKKLEAKQNLTEQTTTPTIETQTTPEPSAKRKSKREVKPKKTIQTAEEVVGETKIRLDVTENELAQPEKEKDKPVGPEFKSTLRSYFDKFKDLFRRKEAEVVTPTESVEAEPPTPDKVNLRDRWDMLRTVRVAQMGNWFKERAKSLFIPVGSKDIPIPTIIGGETVQAEQLRRGTKYAAQNVEAYSTLIQNEILVDKKSGQILDSNDAEEIAQEFVAVEKSRGKEFTPEEFSALVEISLKTRIRDNDGTVDRIVGYTIDTLKERLAKARGQATSESVLTEGKLTEIEEQLRTKLNELRNGRITLDAKALTKVMREVLDRKYWARYIYDLTKLLVIGGIIAYKYSGDQTGNVSTTEEFNVDLPLEKKMEWMDHNLWVTSKKLLPEAGVTNPTNAQTQAVDTVLSMANNVKVIDPETGNVIWSQTVNGQIIDRLMQPGLIDAIQASQLAKEIATGVVKI